MRNDNPDTQAQLNATQAQAAQGETQAQTAPAVVLSTASASDHFKLPRRLLLLAALCLICFLCGRGCDTAPADTDVSTKTEIIHDTIFYPDPVPIHSHTVDTFYLPLTDTITFRDTAYVILPIEQRYYRTDDYEAWVSGFLPSLDSCRVFRETRLITTEITKKERKKRFGLGVQVGYGVVLADGKIKPVPYIGVGLSYNIVRF